MANPGFITNSAYVSPVDINTPITISSIIDTFVPQSGIAGVVINDNSTGSIIVEAPDGSTVTITTDIKASGTYTPKSNGIYTVRYSFTYYKRSAIGETGPYTQNVTFMIMAASNYAPKPLWNIRTVLERILRVHTTKTLKDNKGKTYRLNAEQAAKFEKIPAPEFAITGKTLKEALDIVGSYIHGIPRLRDDTPELTEIYFDMLGRTEKAILSITNEEWLEYERSQTALKFDQAFPDVIPELIFNDETLAQDNEERLRAFNEEIERQQKLAEPLYRGDDDKDYLDPGCTIPYIPEV